MLGRRFSAKVRDRPPHLGVRIAPDQSCLGRERLRHLGTLLRFHRSLLPLIVSQTRRWPLKWNRISMVTNDTEVVSIQRNAVLMRFLSY